MARAAKPEQDVADAPEPETFRELVDAINVEEPEESDPPSLNDLIAGATAQANREGRHADSAALHQLSVRLGDLRIAIRDASARADGPLGEALAVLADQI